MASALAACCALSVTSCIKEEYSLEKLDTAITILPGLEVPLDNEFVLPVLEALGTVKKGEDHHLTVDAAGNYRCPCIFNGNTDFRVSAEDFTRTSVFGFNNTELVFPFEGGPMDPLVKCGTDMDSPVILEIDNPTGIELDLGGGVIAGEKYALVTGVKVPAGKSEIVLGSDEVKAIFRPLPSMAYIYRMFVQKPVQEVPKPASEYVFKLGAVVPLAIMGGEVISYDYECDMVKEMGLDEMLASVDFDFDDIELELEVINKTPFDVNMDLDKSGSEFQGDIDGLKEISAGTPQVPVTTMLNLHISSLDKNATAMKFNVRAAVPQSYNPSVALNEQQEVIFRARSIKFTKGITIK